MQGSVIKRFVAVFACVLGVGAMVSVGAQEAAAPAADERPVVGPGYDDTPMIPGSEWRVHDNRRPHPPVVNPDEAERAELPTTPPDDAIVLFDGTDLSAWRKDNGEPASWKVTDGYMEAVKKGGSIRTRADFGSCILHVEWASPNPPKGDSQNRGNSGVFLMGRYEIQVLDSYESLTYADGQCAALYGQKPPDVNVCRKPGEWQTYDITFAAPQFAGDTLVKPAVVTLYHNGVLVHDKIELMGATAHKNVAKYSPHGKGPISLQDHGSPIRYRNIWIKPLD